MGDEEVLEGEDGGHYESMVFNLLTGNQQGYQVSQNQYMEGLGSLREHGDSTILYELRSTVFCSLGFPEKCGLTTFIGVF